MKAQLFRGSSCSLIAEHVIRNKFYIDEVDRTQTLEVRFGNGEWVETLGQLTLLVDLGTEVTGCSKEQVWQKVTFDVIPNTIAGYRYDAVLSDDDILGFNKDYVEEYPFRVMASQASTSAQESVTESKPLPILLLPVPRRFQSSEPT
jgi:hypothetical protein